MNKILFSGLLLAAGLTGPVSAQEPAQQKSLASTLNVYVFPSAGQAADQQSKDEAECFQWATTNTGVDPFNLSKETAAAEQQAQAQQQQTQQATQGAGAKGAVKGAAAGALIGEIASDDAGEGAAWGAAAGAVAARRRGRAAQQQATQQTEQQVQQAEATEAEKRSNFNKAFSVCLEGKKYLVKF
ncbi:MAG: glycine zipper family protein [Woeseiaceae bacterium]|nr:glycine zipper family protein [Woeseiaceae bacterium]